MIGSSAGLPGSFDEMNGSTAGFWLLRRTSSSRTSLNDIKSTSSGGDEFRLESTRVLSSGTVSTSNLASASGLVGEGITVRASKESRRRRRAANMVLCINAAAGCTVRIWTSWPRRGAETRIAWQGKEFLETKMQNAAPRQVGLTYIALGGRARGCLVAYGSWQRPRALSVGCLVRM